SSPTPPGSRRSRGPRPLRAPRPFGGPAATRLPVTQLCVNVSDAGNRLKIPPALTPLASPGSTSLSLTRVLSMVSTPPLSIPPPSANPQGSPLGPQKPPGGIAAWVSTRLPTIELSTMVTVAPVVLNGGLGLWPVGIQTPPPNVTSGPG